MGGLHPDARWRDFFDACLLVDNVSQEYHHIYHEVWASTADPWRQLLTAQGGTAARRASPPSKRCPGPCLNAKEGLGRRELRPHLATCRTGAEQSELADAASARGVGAEGSKGLSGTVSSSSTRPSAVVDTQLTVRAMTRWRRGHWARQP